MSDIVLLSQVAGKQEFVSPHCVLNFALLLSLAMNNVTAILSAIEAGSPRASEELLPLVYQELRVLAAQRLAQEKPGQTLQPTALVHEAYLRLVGPQPAEWNSQGHFFAAAAEAMRRILVDAARAKHRLKRGGDAQRLEFDDIVLGHTAPLEELLDVNDALDALEQHDPQAAALVKLRFFAGFDHQEAANMLGITRRTADRLWILARTWLYRSLQQVEG
jgi:RNA polymerase sigma factor (TIGR02999 family)